MLCSLRQQVRKTQQWPQDWKRSVFIPVPKKNNAKKCWDYHTIAFISHDSRASLVGQLIKNLPAMQETPVLFLGREDPLEKGKATHSSILACIMARIMACIIHGLYNLLCHRVWSDRATFTFTFPQAIKVMLKILQARLQQFMNQELPDAHAGFQRGRGTIKLSTSVGS